VSQYGLRTGGHAIVDAARCHGCGHPARIHNPAGCVFGQCECVVARAELMPDAPRLEVPDGIVSTPAVKAPAPSNGGGGHAAQGRPVEADAAAAAPVVPVRPSSAWDPPKLRPLPPLPGAGTPRTAPMPGEVATPDESVARQVDDIIAAAKLAARKRPRRSDARPAAPTAQVSRAVVGEPGAVGEVAVAPTSAAATKPEPDPFDWEPFLARALYVSARWYCPKCHHWPVNPGACPGCRKPLQAVYHVTIPRSAA